MLNIFLKLLFIAEYLVTRGFEWDYIESFVELRSYLFDDIYLFTWRVNMG